MEAAIPMQRVETGAVIYFLLGILTFKEKKLRADQGSDCVINFRPQEDDSVLEQTGIDVIGTLHMSCIFNDYRDCIRRHAVKLLHPEENLRQLRDTSSHGQKSVKFSYLI